MGSPLPLDDDTGAVAVPSRDDAAAALESTKAVRRQVQDRWAKVHSLADWAIRERTANHFEERFDRAFRGDE